MKELELLAPARNTDIGIAAIDCGADAVYIAAEEFGARQAAGNPLSEIKRLCDYAHKFGAVIFVTVNTIMYDDELEKVYDKIIGIQEAGADAIIVQDMAVIAMVRQHSQRDGLKKITIPLHASTQCAVRTPERAAELESLGFSRVILERELSLEQIMEIRSAVSCEIEFFVHGALCVCYSGQCYLSEMVAARSANRGACVQACRSRYDLEDESGKVLVRNKALLSLKDYNLINRLGDLAQAGVSSFKIEGRLKNESYVRNVVRAYSLALDNFISTHPDYCRASFGRSAGGFTPDTNKTFNRGYTELYIDGKRGKWAAMDAPKGMGELVGTVEAVNRSKTQIRISPAPAFRRNGVFHNGDGFSFVERNGDVTGFRGDVCEGLTINCKPVQGIKAGTKVYRNLDSAFEREMDRQACKREIGVKIDLDIRRDKSIFILDVHAVSEDGRVIEHKVEAGDQAAENLDRMRSMIISQLSKSTGIYNFELSLLKGEELPFMPSSFLNGIRRDIAAELDSLPCLARPLENHTPDIGTQYAVGKQTISAKPATYRANISNHLSEQVYRLMGVGEVEKAYELTHRSGVELMRTKYCIRHELGMCLKNHPDYRGKLYLVNNGRRFELGFDCARCEMTVLDSGDCTK